MPKNYQIWPKIGIFGQFGPGHAGIFSALLVGRLVVVARGLYLARHLYTLLYRYQYLETSHLIMLLYYYHCYQEAPLEVRRISFLLGL